MTETPDKRSTIILLAENEAAVSIDMEDLLTEAGYRVITVGTADGVVATLSSGLDVKLVIIDAILPGSLNGYGIARFVDQRWPHIPLIVTSNHDKHATDLLPGKARFHLKPYSTRHLLDDVRSLLGEGAEPIIVESPQPIEVPAAPVLPAALKINLPHTGIGATGGLAQPLQEPEE